MVRTAQWVFAVECIWQSFLYCGLMAVAHWSKRKRERHQALSVLIMPAPYWPGDLDHLLVIIQNEQTINLGSFLCRKSSVYDTRYFTESTTTNIGQRDNKSKYFKIRGVATKFCLGGRIHRHLNPPWWKMQNFMCQEKRYWNIIVSGGTSPADFSTAGDASPVPPTPLSDAHV